MNTIAFKMMAHVGLPIRNIFMPPDKMLAEVMLKRGSHVLDFGCGPGTFTTMIAEKIGPSGIVIYRFLWGERRYVAQIAAARYQRMICPKS